MILVKTLLVLSCVLALTAAKLRVKVKVEPSAQEPMLKMTLATKHWNRTIDMMPVKQLDEEKQDLILGYYDSSQWDASCTLYFGISNDFKHALVGVCGDKKWHYKGVLAPVDSENLIVLKKGHRGHHVVEEIESLSSCNILHKERFHEFSRNYHPSKITRHELRKANHRIRKEIREEKMRQRRSSDDLDLGYLDKDEPLILAPLPRDQFYVEIAAFVTHGMAQEHGDDLTKYITTVINGANLLYARPKLNISIILSLNQINVMSERESGKLEFGDESHHALEEFCRYKQEKNFNSDLREDHYDIALLFTNEKMWFKTPYQISVVKGMAYAAGMCTGGGTCALIGTHSKILTEVIITTAHEIAHTMNVQHDDSTFCLERFNNRKDADYNNWRALGVKMMYSSHFNHLGDQIPADEPWSDCSAQQMHYFLQKGHGKCLYDIPQKTLFNKTANTVEDYTFKLPGEVYSHDEQCNMTFGNDSVACPEDMRGTVYKYCEQIQCLKPNSKECYFKRLFLPDGTDCGENSVCYAGDCIRKSNVDRPKHGGWSEWSSYSPCSKSCDGGVSYSYRRCDNPTPQFGGQTCSGTDRRLKTCGNQPCDAVIGYNDDRMDQCNQWFFGMLYRFTAKKRLYEPVYYGHWREHECSLFCKKFGPDMAWFKEGYAFRKDVEDGTKCRVDSTDTCVNGQCFVTGCDGVIGSSKKLNKCGVCDSEEHMCTTFNDSYTYNNDDVLDRSSDGVLKQIEVEHGVTNFTLTKRGYFGHILVFDGTGDFMLRNITQLNGDGKFVFANTEVLYFKRSVKSTYEKITLKGTLSRKLLVKIYEDDSTLNNYPDADISVEWSYNVAENRTYYEQFKEEEDFSLNENKTPDVVDAETNQKRIEEVINQKGEKNSSNNLIHLKSLPECTDLCEKYICTKEEKENESCKQLKRKQRRGCKKCKRKKNKSE